MSRAAFGLISLLTVGSFLACSSATEDPAPSSNTTAGQAGGSGSGSSSSGAATVGGAPSAGSSGSPSTAGQAMGGSTAGTGGAGSAGSGTAGSGSGGMGAACDVFCTDFEAAAIPEKLAFFPEYLRPTQMFITLDAAGGRNGSRALKVTGTDYSQMLGVAVPSKFWGRVYLKSDTDIQDGHNTYVAAGTGTGDPNDGTYIRIGEHKCQLELNRNTDDKELLSNGGQYMCEGGVKLLKDTWYCLEFFYDGPASEVRVFVDDAEVTALHATGWGPYDYKLFKLGFEKYHGGNKTLWYDDLALATQRVGCSK